jgi:hypothetical protein
LQTSSISARPGAAIAPLLGFLLGVLARRRALLDPVAPFLVAALMGAAIVSSVLRHGLRLFHNGANVVVNRQKQTAIWQQGLFGMGVGTEELVPFAKIQCLELVKVGGAPRRGPGHDLLQFELSLLKKSGKTLALGQITVAPAYVEEGLARIREVADAIASITGAPVELIDIDEGPRAKIAAGRNRARSSSA